MPRRYKLQLSKRAKSDLDNIFAFIGRDSPQNAERMVTRILSDIEYLKVFPNRTIVSDQTSSPPLRRLVVYPFVVCFRVNESRGMVTIITVRHGARRPIR